MILGDYVPVLKLGKLREVGILTFRNHSLPFSRAYLVR